MPLFAIGMQNTLVKFYSIPDRGGKVVFYPLQFYSFVINNSNVDHWTFLDEILFFLSKKNPIVKALSGLYLLLVCVWHISKFFSWLRVHMHSVFGNFIKK
jgi:hypothetical protein